MISLPYGKAQAARDIVVGKTPTILSLTATPTEGDAPLLVYFSAYLLTEDMVPVANKAIRFYANGTLIGTAMTDAKGHATEDYKFDEAGTYSCHAEFTGDAKYEGSTSNTVTVTVAVPVYPTRLSISAPSSVAVDEVFTISGKLEYQKDTAWYPLAGRIVSLYYDSSIIGSVTTGSDGSYSKSTSISAPGTYTLKAVFAGEDLAFASALTVLGLPVIPPELEPLAQYATYALSAIPVLAVGGAIAYNELVKAKVIR